MEFTIEVNGRPFTGQGPAHLSLLEFLRAKGFSSVRCGCDTANCGLCTVWVNGKPTLSCAYPAARAAGQKVTTLEGVQPEADRLASYMASQGAEQCGYCSPGFIMAVLAMQRELHRPSEEEIKAYLAGNLCRCTGYASHMRILKSYFEEVQPQ